MEAKPTSKSRQALQPSHLLQHQVSCHACYQRQLDGGPRQEASGAGGGAAASVAAWRNGEDYMLGERAQQHQGRAQLSQASFNINIKFSSMPTLVEEEVFLEGKMQVQPWQRR